MTDVEVEEEPTAAYWLSMIGGFLGLIIGLILIVIAGSIGSLPNSGPATVLFGGIGLWSVFTAIIVMISAYNLRSDPWEHTKWGWIIIIFSIIGLGTLLGLIGGILAVVYKPEESAPYHPPTEAIKRFCPKCGRLLNEKTRFCPYCGNELGS
jgi:hypothetical protein